MLIRALISVSLLFISLKSFAHLFCWIYDLMSPFCPVCGNNLNTKYSFKNGPFCKKHGFISKKSVNYG